MTYEPGPWEARDGQVWGPDPHNDGEILICDTAPDGAALTEYDADHARLIAAAPDMLAALVEAEQFVGDRGDEKDEEEDHLLVTLRAAIARAKGEA